MLYEEMLTHCAQNVYNLTTFYKHQHFIHQECFIQKGILKTTKKVWRIFIFCKLLYNYYRRANFWNFYENIYISIHLRNDK